jgi:hypothetical protein
MKLNHFLWDSFISSSNGSKSIQFFSEMQVAYLTADPRLTILLDKWSSHGELQYESVANSAFTVIADFILNQLFEAFKGLKRIRALNLNDE